MKTGYVVADAMTTKPITCEPDITLKECAQIMKKHDVGSVLVMKGDTLIGIITEYDFVKKAAAEGLRMDETLVRDVMETRLITITPEKDILEALKIMSKHGIRHLPVMEGEKLVGYITMRTILKIEPQLLELITERIELRGIRPDSPLLEEFEEELRGQCEECGNYSSELREIEGKKLCPNCAEE